MEFVQLDENVTITVLSFIIVNRLRLRGALLYSAKNQVLRVALLKRILLLLLPLADISLISSYLIP